MIPFGIFFYIRDKGSNKVWKANYEEPNEKYEAIFAPDISKFIKSKNGIETKMKIIAGSRLGTEIRSINIKNNLSEDVELDVMAAFRPVLSSMSQDIAHPVFNNLFLKFGKSPSSDLVIKRNGKDEDTPIFLGTNLFLENEKDENRLEYEIDLKNADEAIKYGKFSSKLGLVTDPRNSIKKAC